MPPSDRALDPGAGWMVRRLALALALMVGFYGLAFAMIGVLLYLPYLEWRLLDRVELRLLLFSIVSAFLILVAIVPRPDRFEAPGPALLPGRHPRLFAELERVAAAVGQRMPAEVYLVPDVNAWVAQRGGFMGLGSRRVMGLGLLMLQSLETSELRAVLAHEFGHYHGGDTRIGPWIYKTREAIGRTLSALADHSSLLQKPFDWYGRLFLRVTLAVSRHQEQQADALAASLEGASATAAGLRAIHAAALAFPPYWYGAVAPAAAAGFHPPLAAGFGEFTAQPDIKEAIGKAVEEETASPTADPYDTHPPLRDRLAALGAEPAQAAGRPDASAIALLDDLPELERALLAALPDVPHGAALVTANWDAIGGPVCVPQWREIVKQHRRLLGGVTPAGLPTLDWERLGRGVLALQLDHPGEIEHALDAAEWLIEAGLALALVERGYDVASRPGQSIRLEKGPDVLDLGRLREHVIAGPDEWVSFCTTAGIAEVDLGQPTSPARQEAGNSARSDPRAS